MKTIFLAIFLFGSIVANSQTKYLGQTKKYIINKHEHCFISINEKDGLVLECEGERKVFMFNKEGLAHIVTVQYTIEKGEYEAMKDTIVAIRNLKKIREFDCEPKQKGIICSEYIDPDEGHQYLFSRGTPYYDPNVLTITVSRKDEGEQLIILD